MTGRHGQGGDQTTRRWRDLRWDDRGEGVVSAAIAILILAAIGALMWVGLVSIWHETEANTRDKVSEIGR